MSESIECKVSVDTITDKKGKDRVVTVVLKGQKAITIERPSDWDLEDIVEISLTIKCGMMATAEHLGITEYMNSKMLVLRDRDESLQSFSEERLVPAAVQKEIA